MNVKASPRILWPFSLQKNDNKLLSNSFSCDLCEKLFPTLGNLKMHTTEHKLSHNYWPRALKEISDHTRHQVSDKKTDLKYKVKHEKSDIDCNTIKNQIKTVEIGLSDQLDYREDSEKDSQHEANIENIDNLVAYDNKSNIGKSIQFDGQSNLAIHKTEQILLSNFWPKTSKQISRSQITHTKIFPCNLCELSFISQTLLESHKKIHKKYKVENEENDMDWNTLQNQNKSGNTDVSYMLEYKQVNQNKSESHHESRSENKPLENKIKSGNTNVGDVLEYRDVSPKKVDSQYEFNSENKPMQNQNQSDETDLSDELDYKDLNQIKTELQHEDKMERNCIDFEIVQKQNIPDNIKCENKLFDGEEFIDNIDYPVSYDDQSNRKDNECKRQIERSKIDTLDVKDTKYRVKEEKVYNLNVTVPCNHCPYFALSKSNLKRHIFDVHGEKGGLKRHNLTVYEGKPYREKRRSDDLLSIYSCEECGYSANRRNLRNHIRRAHKGVRYPCNQCEYKATENGSLKRHILAVHEGKPYGGKKRSDDPFTIYPCEECGYSANRRNLQNHMKIAHRGVRYLCDQCNFPLTEKGSLKKHLKTFHGGIKNESLFNPKEILAPKLFCRLCIYETRAVRALDRHIKSVHEVISVYTCEYCGHKVQTKTGMSLHIASEHDAIEYVCTNEGCDYKAKIKGNLKIHVDSVHNKVKFPCEKCNYQATQKSSLKVHNETVHQGIKYQCGFCVYKGTTKPSLQIHIDAIHKLITYSCEKCDFVSKYQRTFKEHSKKCITKLNENEDD